MTKKREGGKKLSRLEECQGPKTEEVAWSIQTALHRPASLNETSYQETEIDKTGEETDEDP